MIKTILQIGKEYKTNYTTVIDSEFFKPNDISKRLPNIDDYDSFQLEFKDYDIVDKKYEKGIY